MLLLALVICISGALAALLPPIPEGMKYWAILLTLSFFYPFVLTRTFKSNRADYEFRMLHWFPALIFILWFVLQILSPHLTMLHILTLGFFFLWSLPLVALGIAFIIIFAVHVLRRSRSRITLLVILLSLFTVGALYAEGAGVNPRLQASVFPKNPPTLDALRITLADLRATLGLRSGTSGLLAAVSSSQSSLNASSSNFSMPAVFTSSSSRTAPVLPPMISDKKPVRLTQSGPVELAAVLGATVCAFYFGLLHARARKRV